MFCELYAVIRWWFMEKSLYFAGYLQNEKLKVSGKQKEANGHTQNALPRPAGDYCGDN